MRELWVDIVHYFLRDPEYEVREQVQIAFRPFRRWNDDHLLFPLSAHPVDPWTAEQDVALKAHFAAVMLDYAFVTLARPETVLQELPPLPLLPQSRIPRTVSETVRGIRLSAMQVYVAVCRGGGGSGVEHLFRSSGRSAEDMIAELLQYGLADPDKHIRDLAEEMWRKEFKKGSVPAIMRASQSLRDANAQPQERAAAIRALAHVTKPNNQDVIAMLKPFADRDDESEDVRREAKKALKEIDFRNQDQYQPANIVRGPRSAPDRSWIK